MVMEFRFPALALLAAAILGSCAVEEETPANQDEKMYLDAWLVTHYPEAVRTGIGTYILEDTPGDGPGLVIPGYVRVTYTVTDLDGNITSTSDSLKAKQLGEFNKSYYYGPRVWSVSETSINKGLEDMISDMATGGTRRALIPGWTQTYKRYDTEEEYLKNETGNSHQIYTVRIDEVVEDIMQWQIDTMENYAAADPYFDGADSLSLGFYYKQIQAPESDDLEAMHSDTTIYINYTGKLLNGQVFDTTIEKVAKDNNIYSSGNTYAPVEVTMSSDSTAIQLGGSSVITGFARTLWQMGPMEKGIGMFWSSYGYGSSGSGSLIPEYAPLVFEIEIVKDPDGEDE